MDPAPAAAPPATGDKGSDGEEENPAAADGDDESSTILQLSLHPQPFSQRRRIKFPDFKSFSSAAAWCGKTNIIACATETCARDPGSRQKPTFWIPVHVVDPERPTEHAIFNVVADTPCDSIAFIEWSPPSCERALLVVNSRGKVTIWTQPSKGPLNVARAFNCWNCEHEWRQDQAVVTKWITPQYSYQWTDAGSGTSPLFEERFLARQATISAKWPNFLCACIVLSSGVVQLRWRQSPLKDSSTPVWYSSSRGVLGAGPSGIYAADVLVNDAGSLIVAGVPIGNPSTIVIWEITPGVFNGQQLMKLGASPLPFTAPSWPGMASLAAYLLSWQELREKDLPDKEGPFLQCSPISNFSAYVSPEASTGSNVAAWGTGVAAVAFDPEKQGTALLVVIVEGQYMSPKHPDGGPSMTGWKFQRWESSRQQVAIHSVFEAGAANYGAMSHPMATTWKTVVNKSFPQTKLAMSYNKRERDASSSMDTGDAAAEEQETEPLPVVKCIAKVRFSGHGGEVAVALLGGEVHLFSGPGLLPVENFCVQVGLLVASPALSASGCCLSCAWHDTDSDTSFLKIVRVRSLSSSGPTTAPLERQIADRFWWSLVTQLDWWDAIAYSQSAADEGLVSLGAIAAVLDSDFHSLPNAGHRQHYGPALDRIKCRMLEGADAAEVRALVLDMQARLLLEVLGKGIEAALVNPSTLILDPWQAPSETLTGLGGEAMLVDPALVHQIQSYVDVVLDLASHFLTRLRRYASFCRTLAAVKAPSSNGPPAGSQPPAPASAAPAPVAPTPAPVPTPAAPPAPTTTTPPPLPPPGNQPGGASSNGGNAQVHAWIQGAVAKMSNTDTATVAPAAPPLSMSTSTFPGIPAVRLIGDCYFLHKLCQLLLFCLVFRKRQLPRYMGKSEVAPVKAEESANNGPRLMPTVKTEDGQVAKAALVQPSKEEPVHTRPLRLGSGNAGQGYTADEVKYLFLVLLDLCKRTAPLAHPFPKFPAGASNPSFRLHYIDGQFSVVPEIVEASLGPHMQNLPRPRGADAAGLLMRELELHPPAEEWNKRIMSGGPWSERLESLDKHERPMDLWPRKRRFAERDAACGVETAVGLGSYTGFMGSRRDVITSSWKSVLHAVWHKCMRCGRQTASLVPWSPNSQASAVPSNSREAWWTGRWAYSCPMCGGHWVRVV
ncbi:mediator of RNA polymerase II transcription subunit 16-like isoform X1 [Selaginella moellendorffii]|uniref:mediator of RNA polymerase II transcription subunit 16-like isoform X1 n=1 Tax=Selaginella moellendorffii TaxID=88036 RepID=UPI000D1CD3D7|nr:mediator of RNA polymerase II transcription subunit 16-like isoform X1 [Selaginella moellendorffii]XP_024540756.1 mediator of RNA polymerase II transcription subunit 16-like isoform X1 [Selaginella moellendorffii]XP_024540757.1 mediator of RNA polymerase II transcription subunit 16-like isoform X1 [Selaginella moellendorffii]XP_024540758.1 mediator of RNA polymerase II transcription subunit 16-like isoform X1 [Selaginella moellendorffii]|eukprot:XP_024540755.1 mediator of RNA polymerase II transcription subunit 16-like isoform X1 [Selaginella moellendorffii]